MTGKAVFIDRDGVLNEMVYDEDHGTFDSPRKPGQVRVLPGAGRFLAEIRRRGYLVVVVTNQPGVAKGTLTVQDLESVNAELLKLLCAEGGGWDALYYCPHHPGAGGGASEFARVCECRKPKPGMILQAAKDHGIDLSRSWMVGDGLNDIQAGRAAGCRTVLLTRLKIEQIERFLSTEGSEPDVVADDFDRALEAIAASPPHG